MTARRRERIPHKRSFSATIPPMDWSFAVSSLAAFIAILNPLGAVPIYLTLTSPKDPIATRAVTRNATLTVFLTLFLSALLGHAILRFFGITVPAFRVAGGILVLLMGISMLHGKMSYAKQTPEETYDAAERNSIAIVPLGIPILAGPGAISTSILLAQQAHTISRILTLGVVLVLTTVLVYTVFRAAQRLQRRLGKTELGIVNRVMGLILAAVAVQFIANGLRELFPILR